MFLFKSAGFIIIIITWKNPVNIEILLSILLNFTMMLVRFDDFAGFSMDSSHVGKNI